MCQQCISAERDPQIGLFNAACKECAARHLAHSVAFFEAKRDGWLTPEYRRALERNFGDAWEKGHMRVKAWAARISGTRRNNFGEPQ